MEQIIISASFFQEYPSLGVLGRTGEHEARRISFDCSEVLKTWPEATILCVCRRPCDTAAYPIPLTADGTTYTMPLMSRETAAAGTIKLELRAVRDDTVLKSAIFYGRILPSLNGQKYAPGNPLSDALNRLESTIADAQTLADENRQKNWFTIYSNPNIERATAETYQRQLACHIYPRLGEMDIEDVTTDHIQALCNGMNAAKASKDKTRMVLNMIFETALDEGIIAKNPMKSRRLRITGRASEPTAEYSIEQMRYLVQHIPSVADETDRAYLALQALHPLRLEEVLGLKWEDVDREHMRLHICRAVTHPTRNMPEVKMPKTKASIRTIGLSRIALEFLGEGKPDELVIGGEKPFSYTQVRRMCERIRRDTGFQDRITPIRFRTTVLTDIYDQTKDIKQAQAAAGHTTAAMTLKYYVKGRSGTHEATSAVERAYGIG